MEDFFAPTGQSDAPANFDFQIDILETASPTSDSVTAPHSAGDVVSSQDMSSSALPHSASPAAARGEVSLASLPVIKSGSPSSASPEASPSEARHSAAKSLSEILAQESVGTPHPNKDKDTKDDSGTGYLQILPVAAAASLDDVSAPTRRHVETKNNGSDLLRDSAVSSAPLAALISEAGIKPVPRVETATPHLPSISIEVQNSSPSDAAKPLTSDTTKPSLSASKLSILPDIEVLSGTVHGESSLATPAQIEPAGTKPLSPVPSPESLVKVLSDGVLPPAKPAKQERVSSSDYDSLTPVNNPDLASGLSRLLNVVENVTPPASKLTVPRSETPASLPPVLKTEPVKDGPIDVALPIIPRSHAPSVSPVTLTSDANSANPPSGRPPDVSIVQSINNLLPAAAPLGGEPLRPSAKTDTGTLGDFIEKTLKPVGGSSELTAVIPAPALAHTTDKPAAKTVEPPKESIVPLGELIANVNSGTAVSPDNSPITVKSLQTDKPATGNPNDTNPTAPSSAEVRRQESLARNTGTTVDGKPPAATAGDATPPGQSLAETRRQEALTRTGATPGTTPGAEVKAPAANPGEVNSPTRSLQDSRLQSALDRSGKGPATGEQPSGSNPLAPTAEQRRADAIARTGAPDVKPAAPRTDGTPVAPGASPAEQRRAEALTRANATDNRPAALAGDGKTTVQPTGEVKPAAALSPEQRRAESIARNNATDNRPAALTGDGKTPVQPALSPEQRRAESIARNNAPDNRPAALAGDGKTPVQPALSPEQRRAESIARNGATDHRPPAAVPDANPTRNIAGDPAATGTDRPRGRDRVADAPADTAKPPGKGNATGDTVRPVKADAPVETVRPPVKADAPADVGRRPVKADAPADTGTPPGSGTSDSFLNGRQQRQLETLRQQAETGTLTRSEQRQLERLTALETRKAEIASATTDPKTRAPKVEAPAAEVPRTPRAEAPGSELPRTPRAEAPVSPPRENRRGTTEAPAGNPPGNPLVNPDGNPKGRNRDGGVTAEQPPGTDRGPFKPGTDPALKPGSETVFRPGGDQAFKPTADMSPRDIRRALAEARQNQPLDPAQQKWLAEQTAKMGDGRSQNFARNFENLSPQNRAALMGLEGPKQGDMIAKLGRGRADISALEGKLGALPGGDLKAGRTADGATTGGKPPLGLDGLKGPAGDIARGPGGELARGPGGDLAKALQRADLKIPGLDVADPSNRQFLADASLRFNNLKFDGTNANMKVSDVLKGMDPQKVMALEKFLSGNNQMLEPGKLTFGQLDQTKVTQLQSLLRGNFDASGRQMTPQESFRQLTQGLLAQQADSNLIGRGRLPEIGKLLNDQPTARLSEMVSRTLDARSPVGTMGGAGGVGSFDFGRFDFTAKLNPVQEIHVRNLLDNSSKLATLLEQNIARTDLSQPRFDVGKAIGLAQVMATTLGDSRGDFAVRGDIRSMIDSTSAVRVSEAGEIINTASGAKSADYIAKLPIDATTGLPYDPASGKLLDPNTGRPIGDRVAEEKKSSDKKWDKDDEDFDEKEKKKKKQDSDVDSEKAKQKAMLLLLQAKKKREQELKDKALRDQKRKEEDEKRVKYICKDGDTVQSIALKQLRDSRVTALIYQINKEVIPTRIVNGEQVPVLHAGLVIWLPSPKEIREFRTKLVSGSQPGTEPHGAKEFASVEDELAARFGENWSGDGESSPEQAADSASAPAVPQQNSIEKKLMDDAIADAKRRRENIEAALGPIASSKAANRAPTGQIIYQVRLGDTLRSVAQKQPSLGDVHLWRLLAEVNGLSTETDAKGQPVAGLSRGSKIKLPTQQEIADYRQRIGSMAGQPMPREQRVSKTCRTCGKVNPAAASSCTGCGYQFGTATQANASASNAPVPTSSVSTSVSTTPVPTSQATAPQQSEPKDAATILLEGMSQTTGGRTEDLDQPPQQGPATVNTDAAQSAPPAEAQMWASVKDFEAGCRLAKSAHSWETASGKLIIQLQIKEDNKDWYPILEYDIFESHALRHSFIRETGAKKSVRIDLPAAAAMELAQNDLLANWNNYKTKFFA